MTDNPSTPTDPHDLETVVNRFADVMRDSETATSHLTCTEVDAMLHLLLISGRADAAESVLIGHASGDDDETDLHRHIWQSQQDADGVLDHFHTVDLVRAYLADIYTIGE